MITAAQPKILIVDDDLELAQHLGEFLTRSGYQTQLAASCAAALALKDEFVVALVDVCLPDGNGITLARQLKERWQAIEVILLTGFATLESAVAAVRAGAWAYLIKPCSTGSLLLALQQAVRQVKSQTEQRRRARQAQVAEKLAAVGTLAAGLSHEIKNPLNAASLQLIVLERRLRRLPVAYQPGLLEPLTLVQQEIRRLASMLEEFLAFTRPRGYTPKLVDLAEVAAAVAQMFAPQAEDAGVGIETQLAAVGPVLGDIALLKQAVANLLLNALQATPTGGWVRLEVSQQSPDIRLCVEDSGAGISPQVREHLFEPFFTTKNEGSGLGLAQVHAIVAQHGGDILVEAGSVGGARLVINLPAHQIN